MSEKTGDLSADDQVIEGGEITGIGPGEGEFAVDPLKKARAQTTRTLAYVLIGILASTFILHYTIISIMLFTQRTYGIEPLNSVFTTWLPVISGLASSAVTYYFTREKP
ncbi:MAG: hypothetical protein ABSE06_01360 [Anaerolineaceae bacterium]|jgi:hypothetical protein